MEENTYKMVFDYISQSETPVSPHELSRVTAKSRVSVHTALKKLLSNGDIEKIGVSPRVTYAKQGFIYVPPTQPTIEDISLKVQSILKRYPIIYAGIFGAIARGETEQGNEIDIMISPNGTFSVSTLTAIEQALTAVIGTKVNLATDQGANKFIKSSMLKGLKVIYGKI